MEERLPKDVYRKFKNFWVAKIHHKQSQNINWPKKFCNELIPLMYKELLQIKQEKDKQPSSKTGKRKKQANQQSTAKKKLNIRCLITLILKKKNFKHNLKFHVLNLKRLKGMIIIWVGKKVDNQVFSYIGDKINRYNVFRQKFDNFLQCKIYISGMHTKLGGRLLILYLMYFYILHFYKCYFLNKTKSLKNMCIQYSENLYLEIFPMRY